MLASCVCFFFFQAEDGIRDYKVTGVQTCALPIFSRAICIVDAHGTVRRANRVFAELIQVPVTAIPGRPWLGLVPPAWSDPVARALAEAAPTTVEIRFGERILLLAKIGRAHV